MAKLMYISPILRDLEPTSDPNINFGASQGTSGYDSQWTFDGIDEATLILIDANCDDTDLAAMDTDRNLVITLAEFQAWYDENEPW